METVPFEDPLAKIDNARDHIRRVESEFALYCGEGPLFSTEASAGATYIRFGREEPVPKKITMAAGDAIHNLRSALDIMAGDVVEVSGGSRKNVYFPFARSEDELDGQIKEKKFDRAAPEAIELLKTFKSYKGGNAALRGLHDLDISDKHLFIIPADKSNTVSMTVGGVSILNCSFAGNGRSDIGIYPSAPFSVPRVKPGLIFGPKQPLAGEDVIPTLHGLSDLTLTIVKAFADLFGSRGIPASSSPARQD